MIKLNKLYNNKILLSQKAKLAVICVAIASSVLLPELFHWLGIVSGLGSSLGEVFLPMHIAVIAAGFIAGPLAGATAGLLSPVISYALSNMPTETMLPYIIIELAVYGITAGLLNSNGRFLTVNVLLVQIFGRAMRALAMITGVCFFDSPVSLFVIYTSIVKGLPGILLQLVLIPLFIYRVKNSSFFCHDEKH